MRIARVIAPAPLASRLSASVMSRSVKGRIVLATRKKIRMRNTILMSGTRFSSLAFRRFASFSRMMSRSSRQVSAVRSAHDDDAFQGRGARNLEHADQVLHRGPGKRPDDAARDAFAG